jgi:hypothetical protein
MTTELEVSHEAGYAVIKAGYVKEAASHVAAYAVIRVATSAPVWISPWRQTGLRTPPALGTAFSQFQPGAPIPDPEAAPPPVSWLTAFGQPYLPRTRQMEAPHFPLAEPIPDPSATPAALSWYTGLDTSSKALPSSGDFLGFIPSDLTPASSTDALSWLTPLDASARKRRELDLEAAGSGFGFVVPMPPVPYVPEWYTAFSVRPTPMAARSSWLITTRDLQVSPPLPFRKPFVRGYVLT